MDNNDIYKYIISKSKNPNDAKVLLKELLELDNHLYSEISQVACKYGNGTHPKHRVTNYHGFFMARSGGDSVLDLGSGRGDVTYDVATMNVKEVLGIEGNANNVRYANDTYKLPNLKFIQGDIYNDIPKRHYRMVMMSNVLEHLDNRVELLKMIVERTKPRSILLRVPHFEREWMVPVKKELGVDYMLDKTHYIEYTTNEFYDEMHEAKLRVNDIQINWGEIWAECEDEDMGWIRAEGSLEYKDFV